MATSENPLLPQTNAEAKAHSSQLRRELGLLDLALAQVLIIIVPEFFGTAVKAGKAHVVLWLVAIVFFFIPHAFVVAHLNRLMPLEGGLYEWARLAFSDEVGFLTAWNMWLLQTIQVAQIALVATTYLSYATPAAAWIATSQPVLIATSVALIAGMMVLARYGLRISKWVSNAGSIITILVLAALVLLPYMHLWRGSLRTYHPVPLVLPSMTLFSLSVFSKMTFGALSGFETIATLAGESRSPARNIGRSVLLSAPLIALLYVFGTSSILAFVAPDAVDVIGPVPQAITTGFARLGGNGTGMNGALAPIVILLLLMNYLSSYTLYFSTNARLPMVAGWDHLLPKWFTPLHPKYRTPVNSILFMGGVAFASSVAVLIGAGSQESFALLQTWAWTFYALAYLAMFAIPLVSAKDKGLRPNIFLQLGCASGFLVTLLYVATSVVPIVDVTNRWQYALKIVAAVVGAEVFGWLIYRAGSRKVPA